MPLLSAPELAISHRRNQEQLLPGRGVKEFAPSNSWLESKQIQSALEERKSLLEAERIDKLSSRACAVWLPDKNVAEVTRKVGKHWQTMGCEKGGKLLLNPEEALYLMETNVLELLYGGVAMSVQQAYTLLLGPQCSLAEYRTYSKLQRLGFHVLRHRAMSPYREPISQSSGMKRQRNSDREEYPIKKKANISVITSNKKPEAKIELIDLEDDEPNGFDLFVPNMVGKEHVSIKVPPSHLLPDNVRPLKQQYFIKTQNLQEPGQGARPLPPQKPPSYYQGQPRQYTNQFPGMVNPNMGQMLQRYTAQQNMQQRFQQYQRYMSGGGNQFNNNFRYPYQQFMRPLINFGINRLNFNFPFLPRVNTMLNTTHTTQYYANQFLAIGRTVIQQTSHQIAYPPQPPPLIRHYNPMPQRPQLPIQHSQMSSQVPLLPRSQENTHEAEERNLTPPPNPIVPKLKAKSWAEVKAKLANSIEIITLDEDNDDLEPVISQDKPLLHPEDCKSLGTVLSKLQIFGNKPSKKADASKGALVIKFDAFRASSTLPFRKSELNPPDYHIAVINNPDIALTDGDFAGTEDKVPVLFAVVQPDTINFFTLSDVNLALPISRMS